MEKNSNLKNNNDQKPKKCGLAAIVESIEKDNKKKKTKKTKPSFNTFQQTYAPTDTFKGLLNFGNACYSNVVIQILTSINEFVSVLFKVYKIIENEDDLFDSYPIISRMVEVINCYKSKIIIFKL